MLRSANARPLSTYGRERCRATIEPPAPTPSPPDRRPRPRAGRCCARPSTSPVCRARRPEESRIRDTPHPPPPPRCMPAPQCRRHSIRARSPTHLVVARPPGDIQHHRHGDHVGILSTGRHEFVHEELASAHASRAADSNRPMFGRKRDSCPHLCSWSDRTVSEGKVGILRGNHAVHEACFLRHRARVGRPARGSGPSNARKGATGTG